MMRKIVQVAAAKGGEEYPDLFAVCNDGTAWQLLGHESEWRALPMVPQPEKPGPAQQASCCQVVQYNDQVKCGTCGLAWDVNDPSPPECGLVKLVKG